MSHSYREILRSSSIIGGASLINVLVGLLRVKLAAVLLGPVGIGVIGLFQNLVLTAATISALGFGNVGTRQIAEASGHDDAVAVAAARRALFWGTLFLSAAGAALVWLLRETVAASVLDDSNLAGDVGWLALGVALTVAAGSQSALLNGLRRVGDIARVSVLSSLLGTLLGVGALWLWRERGVLAFVLSAPLAGFLLGHLYVSRLPRMQAPPTPLPQLLYQWRALARLGAPFMLAGLVLTVGQLVVRTMVHRELGAEALGYFQASWMISMTYVGLVLTAMGTDYYPRLTAAINDHATVNRLVNEQTEVALLLAGPILLAVIGLAPWVVDLLYSSRFGEATGILRWQVLGDVFKVASFPLGYIILARGDGTTFLLAETSGMAVFVGLTWIGLPLFGIQSAGIAFFGMYVMYLPLVYILAHRRTGFRWAGRVGTLLVHLSVVAFGVHGIANWSVHLGAVAGVAASSVFGMYALVTLAKLSDSHSPIGAKLRVLGSKVSWIRDR